MNNISEQLLQAIDILADAKVSKLQYDKTIQATIYRIENIDEGEYKVRYNGNIFSAYSDPNTTYKVDDSVYVTVPEGNFSNRKIITALASSQSLNTNQQSALQNSIFDVSPELSDLYGGIYDTTAAIGVVASLPVPEPMSQEFIYRGPDIFDSNDYHGLFQQYSNRYENIRISAKFQTQFHTLMSKGNYGLEVVFYTKDNGEVAYNLDLNSFNGDPYRFSVYSPQSVVISVQKNYLMGLKSIRLFQTDFSPDHFVVNGEVADKENLTVPNIFVKDISIKYVEVKDLSDSTYYLQIATPQGIAFSNNVSSLDLKGQLIYQGKDIMSNSSCTCQWFARDASVMIGEDNYSKDAGPGWWPIGGDFNILHLKIEDVLHQQKYKLVVWYKDKVKTVAEVEIFNHKSKYDFIIKQITDTDDIKLQLVNNVDDEVLLGDWYLSYPDGSYNSVVDGKNQSNIVANPYLKYTSVVFYCSVKNSNNQYLGTLEHIIMNSQSSDDITISYDGEDIFRYDANGDVTIENSEKERTLQVRLTWKENYGTAYNVDWLIRNPEGLDISLPRRKESAYQPSNSMIKELWVDNYNILHYTIKQKYKSDFNNNSIIVQIQTISEQTYRFEKEILFLKDGDQGTNGTTYVTAIRPYDKSTGLKLSGLQPLTYNNGWGDSLALRCYVYKDGELINEDTNNYDIEYTWTGINISITEKEDKVDVNGTTTISSSSPHSDLEFYIKAQVDIDDKMNNRQISIYTSYPIDVAVGNIIPDQVDISSIPSYIKYTASGVNPTFYSNSIQFLYNNNVADMSSVNENILQIYEMNGLKYLKPASSFIFENKDNKESNIGIIKCAVNNNAYLLHPVIMYLDTYGNEAINGWDGEKIAWKNEDGSDNYIYAPQIGAGEKDSFNRFCGIIMGKDKTQDMIGLYGYDSGINTFGLMQNGKAFFGAKSGGGQIVIDGTTATIYGGGQYPAGSGRPQVGGDAENGMTITLANLGADKTTNAIKIGQGVFQVKYDGSLIASAATITGTIRAKEGRIGCRSDTSTDGWIIGTNRLYSGSSSTRVALDSSTSSFAIWAGANEGGDSYSAQADFANKITNPAPFVVTRDGFLYSKNAYISGTIAAKQGEIGGWKIRNNRLESEDGTLWLSPTGGISLGSAFSVSASGYLRASGASISGSISADSISVRKGSYYQNILDASNNISGSYINCRGLYVSGTNGSYFSVDSYGNVSMSGSISMGVGSSINWNTVTEYGNKPYATTGDIPSLPAWAQGTYITGASIYSPYIYFGTNNSIGGTNSNIGVLYPGYGNNGVNKTNVIYLIGYQGIRIEASGGGLALYGAGGIWCDSQLNASYGLNVYGNLAVAGNIWLNGQTLDSYISSLGYKKS